MVQPPFLADAISFQLYKEMFTVCLAEFGKAISNQLVFSQRRWIKVASFAVGDERLERVFDGDALWLFFRCVAIFDLSF